MENADAYHANGDSTLKKRSRENDEDPVESAEAEVAGPKRAKQELSSQENADIDTDGVPLLGDSSNDQKSDTEQGQSGDNIQQHQQQQQQPQQQQQQQALQHQQLMQQLAFQQMAALAAAASGASGFPQQPFNPMMLNPAVLQQMCMQMQALQQFPTITRASGASNETTTNETTTPSPTATATQAQPPEQANDLSQQGNVLAGNVNQAKDETAPAAQPATAENQTNPDQPSSPSVNQQQQQQQQQQGGVAMMPPMFFPQMNQIQRAQNAYAQLLMNSPPFQQMFRPVYQAPIRRGINLALACDHEQLSEYQILVRQQLEIFEAGPEDVDSNTQGRKKSVVLGQVGLRCKHCALFPLRARGRGAVYYPAKLQGIYQAAQNMAGSHLIASCQQIPPQLQNEIRELRETRMNASGGKQYWADACEALGLYETEHGLKLNARTSANRNI